jgi:hypothetical protein
MRGILDTGMFLQPAAGMELIETVLEASTEYSIIGLRLDGPRRTAVAVVVAVK